MYPRLIFLTVTLALSSHCAAQSLKTAAHEVIRLTCPEASVPLERLAMGDLNGDGIDDVAALVGCSDPMNQEILVLLGDASGSFSLTHRTQVWEVINSRDEGLKIASRTLTYSQWCAASCRAPWTADFKFRMREGRLILISEEHTHFGDLQYSPQSGVNEVSVTFRRSINYLSGKVVYSRATRTRRVEKRLSFIQPPIQFSHFSPDGQMPRARELKGHIDEGFKLRFPDDR